MQVRGVSEKSLQTFERPGIVKAVHGDAEIEWIPERLFLPWRTQLKDLEFVPPLCAKGKQKSGKTSQADLSELRLRIPGLEAKLRDRESLTSEHVVLGD